MCLYPRLILNKRYVRNKKNGGFPPPIIDQRTRYVPIGCQQCMECRKQQSRQWQCRLTEDIKTNTNAKFITLTFSNESIKHLTEEIYRLYEGVNIPEGYDLDNMIATLAIRRFTERFRKKYKRTIRHWLVTELGHNGTENIHMHGIIWTDLPLEEIEKIWQYGFMWKYKLVKGRKINYVNEQTVNYIVKYVNKVDHINSCYKPKILTSKGIGSNYTKIHGGDWEKNKFNHKKTIETYRTRKGLKINLPIYYRNKIYTEQERTQLWINRLDKQERWILGERISIKNGEEQYLNVLNWAQSKNKRLGYGDGTKDWVKKEYETEHRKLRQMQRINVAKN